MPPTRQKRKSEVSAADVKVHLSSIISIYFAQIEKDIPEKPLKPQKRTKRESKPKDSKEDTATNGVEERIADKEEKEVQYWLMKAEPESRIVKGKVGRSINTTNIRMLSSASTTSRI
jgi:hypothetical protein